MIAVCIQSEGILVQSPRSRFKQKSRTWIQIQVFDIETKLLMIFYELTLLAMGLWYVCEAMVYCISFNRCIIKKEQWCQTLTISWWKHRGSHQTSWRNRYGRYRCFWTSSTTFFGDLSTKIFWRNRNGHNLLSHLPIVWWAKASLCFAFSWAQWEQISLESCREQARLPRVWCCVHTAAHNNWRLGTNAFKIKIK